MPTADSGLAAVKALDRAMTDYRAGLYDVLVTGPVNNANAQMDNYPSLVIEIILRPVLVKARRDCLC